MPVLFDPESAYTMSAPEIHDHVRGSRRAILYARVSSKEQEQGYSIQAQQEFLRLYAAQHDLVIDKEFVDVHTARRPGRGGFNEMLHYLRKNPGCRVILVEKTDRLYRNLADTAAVEALVEGSGVEVHLQR